MWLEMVQIPIGQVIRYGFFKDEHIKLPFQILFIKEIKFARLFQRSLKKHMSK
jgi:hypothetical protein